MNVKSEALRIPRRELLGQRPPRGYVGTLLDKVGIIGQQIMAPAIALAPSGSRISGAVDRDNVDLEIQFLLGAVTETGRPVATECTIVLSEHEPYVPDPQFDFYVARTLILDIVRQRRKLYELDYYVSAPDIGAFNFDEVDVKPDGSTTPIDKTVHGFGRSDFNYFTGHLDALGAVLLEERLSDDLGEA